METNEDGIICDNTSFLDKFPQHGIHLHRPIFTVRFFCRYQIGKLHTKISFWDWRCYPIKSLFLKPIEPAQEITSWLPKLFLLVDLHDIEDCTEDCALQLCRGKPSMFDFPTHYVLRSINHVAPLIPLPELMFPPKPIPRSRREKQEHGADRLWFEYGSWVCDYNANLYENHDILLISFYDYLWY
jgi:hypothetical protein